VSTAQATDKSNKSTPTNTIDYDEAVYEGKKIVTQIEDVSGRCQWRLGELAHNIEKGYGERKLAKFADAIGVAPCTLSRYRDVYRAWKDICAPGRECISDIPYSVLRELATLDDHVREQIIRDNPKITKREAREEVRKHKGTAKQKQDQEDEWLRDTRRWFRDLVAAANEASRVAGNVDLDECTSQQLDNVLQAIDPASLMYVRRGGRMLFKLANDLAELLGVDAEEASVPIERVHPEPTAHAVLA
jgi:hypothetical protein